MSDKQAYAGNAAPGTEATEYSRTKFIAESVANRMATNAPVKVMAVTMIDGHPHVDVQPLVGQLDGANNAVPHGTIHNLPVEVMQAGLSAIILVPKVGDMGMVAFCQSDISSVKKTKKAGNPGSRRKFDWADGVYRAGVFNGVASQVITISDDDGITITTASDKPLTINAPGSGGVSITTGGDVSIDADGDVNVTAAGDATLDVSGTTTITGNVQMDGDLNVDGAFTAPNGATLDGKDFATHAHSGVTTGGGNSGPPV